MRRRRDKRRCFRCGKRHDIWIWVGDEIVCGVCATLDEFGGAIGAVGSRPSHLRALGDEDGFTPDGGS